jgi:hypothetical protein
MDFLEIDFNILKTEIHQTAKEKGWWDKPRSKSRVIMLIISEVTEALESRRNGTNANLKAFTEYCGSRIFDKHAFEQYIKDTDGDELGDAVIRILDDAAHKDINIDPKKWKEVSDKHYFACEDFDDSLLSIVRTIASLRDFTTEKYVEEYTNLAILQIAFLAEKEGIDLLQHILLKMRYNKTRERLHGKKF